MTFPRSLAHFQWENHLQSACDYGSCRAFTLQPIVLVEVAHGGRRGRVVATVYAMAHSLEVLAKAYRV